jgi:hypothetical protein
MHRRPLRRSTQWTGNPTRYHLFTYRWHYPAMEPMARVLGPASTNFKDYLGTVAADDTEALMYEPSLYELADLDRDRYTVLAVDLRVEVAPQRLSTPSTEWSIRTHYPARSRSGAKVKTFRLCRSTSLKRVLKSSSDTPSAESRFDW